MNQYSLIDLLWVALFAAGCTFVFNRKLASLAREWEEKRHIVRTSERFCDELMELAMEYWSSECSAENCEEMRVLTDKISAYNILLLSFLGENFSDNAEIRDSLYEVIDTVTRGNFGVNERNADSERVASSVAALTNLRLEISRITKKKNSGISVLHGRIKRILWKSNHGE